MTDQNIQISGFPSFKHTSIETEHLFMRPSKPTDWQAWLKVRRKNQLRLQEFEPKWADNWDERILYLKRVARQEKEWNTDLGYAFHLFKKDKPDEIIGGININHVCRGAAQFAYLGYWIAQAHEKQGFMLEGLQAIICFCWSPLNLKRLNAGTLKRNEASSAILQKLGFEEEGFAKKFVEINDVREDHVLYGLNRD